MLKKNDFHKKGQDFFFKLLHFLTKIASYTQIALKVVESRYSITFKENFNQFNGIMSKTPVALKFKTSIEGIYTDLSNNPEPGLLFQTKSRISTTG